MIQIFFVSVSMYGSPFPAWCWRSYSAQQCRLGKLAKASDGVHTTQWHSGSFDELYYCFNFVYDEKKLVKSWQRNIKKKGILLSFAEFFQHTSKCETMLKFVKTTNVRNSHPTASVRFGGKVTVISDKQELDCIAKASYAQL